MCRSQAASFVSMKPPFVPISVGAGEARTVGLQDREVQRAAGRAADRDGARLEADALTGDPCEGEPRILAGDGTGRHAQSKGRRGRPPCSRRPARRRASASRLREPFPADRPGSCTYQPTGSVFASTKPPFVPIRVGEERLEPSGFRIERFREQQGELPIVTAAAPRLTRCPGMPSNVSRAFWPGTGPMPTVTDVPPATIGPATSAGTSYSVRVALPIPEFCGSTRIVYVPLAGSVFVSTKPPFVPIGVGGTSVVPSGLVIESVIEQQRGSAERDAADLQADPLSGGALEDEPRVLSSGGGGHGQGRAVRCDRVVADSRSGHGARVGDPVRRGRRADRHRSPCGRREGAGVEPVTSIGQGERLAVCLCGQRDARRGRHSVLRGMRP